jgi:hypothetical protein
MLDSTPNIIVTSDTTSYLFDNPPQGYIVVLTGVEPNATDTQD